MLVGRVGSRARGTSERWAASGWRLWENERLEQVSGAELEQRGWGSEAGEGRAEGRNRRPREVGHERRDDESAGDGGPAGPTKRVRGLGGTAGAKREKLDAAGGAVRGRPTPRRGGARAEEEKLQQTSGRERQSAPEPARPR